MAEFRPTRREVFAAKSMADNCIRCLVHISRFPSGHMFYSTAVLQLREGAEIESSDAFELAQRIAARNQERTK